jgi:carbonic anhydrase/acetyltransferase-like protein (isoleucine patch superfamily)
MHIEPDSLPTGHGGIVARLQKGPTVHSSAWVVPGATVLGDVILEEESSVWYGAVLRGDINRIIIGPRSNVQDNAVVHVDTGYPTTVGELVTIGHTAIVHACKVDNEVFVGMGAIILDDVEIGARSIIGANALVTMGMKIPPGSLVLGSPAKIRRQLTLEEQNDIARWAWSYVAAEAAGAGVHLPGDCRQRLWAGGRSQRHPRGRLPDSPRQAGGYPGAQRGDRRGAYAGVMPDRCGRDRSSPTHKATFTGPFRRNARVPRG